MVPVLGRVAVSTLKPSVVRRDEMRSKTDGPSQMPGTKRIVGVIVECVAAEGVGNCVEYKKYDMRRKMPS